MRRCTAALHWSGGRGGIMQISASHYDGQNRAKFDKNMEMTEYKGEAEHCTWLWPRDVSLRGAHLPLHVEGRSFHALVDHDGVLDRHGPRGEQQTGHALIVICDGGPDRGHQTSLGIATCGHGCVLAPCLIEQCGGRARRPLWRAMPAMGPVPPSVRGLEGGGGGHQGRGSMPVGRTGGGGLGPEMLCTKNGPTMPSEGALCAPQGGGAPCGTAARPQTSGARGCGHTVALHSGGGPRPPLREADACAKPWPSGGR